MAMTFYDAARAQSFTPPNNNGRVHYARKRLIGQNGRGDAIVAQHDTLTWRWNLMSKEDMDWWIFTFFNGAASVRCSGATQIYNHVMVKTTSLTQAIVHRPTFSHWAGGFFVDVEIKITNIIW